MLAFLYCLNLSAKVDTVVRRIFASKFITVRKRNFAKVMFSQVSVCSHGGVISPLHAGIHPTGQMSPWADTPLRSACWDTVNKRAVLILLECILVQLVSITNLLLLKVNKNTNITNFVYYGKTPIEYMNQTKTKVEGCAQNTNSRWLLLRRNGNRELRPCCHLCVTEAFINM